MGLLGGVRAPSVAARSLTKLHFNNVASGGLGWVRARFQHVQCVCGKCCGLSWTDCNGVPVSVLSGFTSTLSMRTAKISAHR